MSTIICNYETESRKLDIAFLGYTNELAVKGLKQLAKNNKEQVLKFRVSYCDCELCLKDGTRLIAITFGERFLHGYKFDQLILFDDDRWMIKDTREKEICEIVNHTMCMSNVPKEFQILEYEDIKI